MRKALMESKNLLGQNEGKELRDENIPVDLLAKIGWDVHDDSQKNYQFSF